MRCLLAIGIWTLSLIAATATAAAEYEATLHFSRRVELGLPVSGVVARVAAQPGARVPKDALLVALEPTPFEAAVAQAEAEVAQATAAQTEAARDFRQAKELFDRTVLSAVELENAKLAAQRAEAELKRARARLEQARYELRHSAVRAPFEAWVLEVRVQPGQSVVSALEARPLVVLAAFGEYEARARLPREALAALEIGRAVQVRVGDKRYTGRVQSLALEPASAYGGGGEGYEVRVVFNASERLAVGQNVRLAFD